MKDTVSRGKVPAWFASRVRKRFRVTREMWPNYRVPVNGFAGIFPRCFDHIGRLKDGREDWFINEPYPYGDPLVMRREAITTALVLGLELSIGPAMWNTGTIQYRFSEHTQPLHPTSRAKYFIGFEPGAKLQYVGRVLNEYHTWDTALTRSISFTGGGDDEERVLERSTLLLRYNTAEELAEGYSALVRWDTVRVVEYDR